MGQAVQAGRFFNAEVSLAFINVQRWASKTLKENEDVEV
jgi:hypothetical protein